MKNLAAFLALGLCCLLATSTFSQTTFTGAISNDWADAGNWDNGLPAISNDATIPAGLSVEFRGYSSGLFTNNQGNTSFPIHLTNFGNIIFNKITLMDGEEVVMKKAANHLVSNQFVGGKLYLTNMRVVFVSHGLNLINHEISFFYQDIYSCVKSKLGNGMIIITENGEEFPFVVWGRKVWIAEINNRTQLVDNSENDEESKLTFEEENESKAGKSTSDSNSNIRIRISDSGQDISKVAVIGKESTMCDGSSDDGVGIGELVSGELVGLYGVVERQHLDDILNEQRLAMGGLIFEDSDYAKAGCLAGAQGTVLASYGCLQGKTKIQVKLVDCSTADIYWSATGVDVSEFELLDELRVKLESR